MSNTPKDTNAPGPATDWEAIERDYRAGMLSVREIATARGISHTAINKRAKAEGWERDLQAKIKAKAEAEVSRRAVSTEVSKADRIAEKQIVEAVAAQQVHVRMVQRKDIQRSRSVGMRLLNELELQAGPENAALLEELGELMHRPDDKGQDKLNELYQKIISLPGRVKTFKDLSEALRITIGLERQAFGIGDGDDDDALKGGARTVIVPAKDAA